MATASHQKRKHDEGQTETGTQQKETLAKTRRVEEGAGSSGGAYPTNPEFLVALIHTRCEQLRLPENKVFIAERSDKLVDVFQGMVKHNFLSVPVLQKTRHKWYGFVDLMDIVQYITEHFGEPVLSVTENFWDLIAKEENFQEKTVSDVMKWPLSRRYPYRPVKVNFSLLYVMEALAKEKNLHRVAIIDNDVDRNLINVITQSRVISFLQQNLEKLGEKRNKPVAEMEGVFHKVFSVKETQRAIEAFQEIRRHDVLAVAVVDDEGRLVGNVSATDLRTMSPDGRLFWRLYQTLDNYLRKTKKEDHEHHRPSGVQSVKVDDTVETVINKLADLRIHRLYIVDDERKPIGIIALKDILLEILS